MLSVNFFTFFVKKLSNFVCFVMLCCYWKNIKACMVYLHATILGLEILHK